MAFLLSSPSHLHLPVTNLHRPTTPRLPAVNHIPHLSAAVTNLQSPRPPLRDAKLDGTQQKESGGGGGGGGKNEFYLNLGVAVRTLREDMPALFCRDLNYDIYRDDITFLDPLNTFQGIENYKLIFWALRFHGRILFREINLEVRRIWQPSENVILIRWNLKGVPRLPWEAKGQFQGTSRYKLDRNGKIYEHKVDNLAFNFPRMEMRPAMMLDLVVSAATYPASPNLSFLLDSSPLEACSWVELYHAVRETLHQEGNMVTGRHDGLLLTCS